MQLKGFLGALRSTLAGVEALSRCAVEASHRLAVIIK